MNSKRFVRGTMVFPDGTKVRGVLDTKAYSSFMDGLAKHTAKAANWWSKQNNATKGAIIGGASGAVIGGAKKGVKGALIGAAGGAAAGGAIGYGAGTQAFKDFKTNVMNKRTELNNLTQK